MAVSVLLRSSIIPRLNELNDCCQDVKLTSFMLSSRGHKTTKSPLLVISAACVMCCTNDSNSFAAAGNLPHSICSADVLHSEASLTYVEVCNLFVGKACSQCLLHPSGPLSVDCGKPYQCTESRNWQHVVNHLQHFVRFKASIGFD